MLILAHRTPDGTVGRMIAALNQLSEKVKGFSWDDDPEVNIQYFAQGRYTGKDWLNALSTALVSWKGAHPRADVDLENPYGVEFLPTSTALETLSFFRQHEGDIDLPGVVLVVATHPKHMEQAKAVMPPELREKAVLISVDHVDWTWRDTAIVRIAVLLEKMGLSKYIARLNRILGRA